VSMTAPVPVTIVPAIATASFLHSSHARVGTIVPLSLGGVAVPVKIVATVTDFPTITGPGGALIVDQTALGRMLASKRAAPPPVTEWWLRTAAGRAPAGLPPGSAVATRAHATTALLTNPLSVAPQQAALAIAVASVLLAVVGFSVSVAASLRARRVQRAVLSALGVSRAGLASQLCLEQLLMSLPAACTGLLAGVLIAHLVVPADTLTTAATLPVPPVLVVIPLGLAALLALAVAAIPVAAAAATVALRPDPAPQLRSAEAV
jgi:FtsX-like permease family